MQILFNLDPRTARELEKVAPARSRRRSAFIRTAIRKAIWEAQERHTRRAYAQRPDEEAVYFDASVWDDKPGRRRPRSR
jgi:hypothetical protein